jgi:hypothetical protein
MMDLEEFKAKWGWRLEGCDVKRVYETYVALRVVEIERRIETNPRLMAMCPPVGDWQQHSEDWLRKAGFKLPEPSPPPGTPALSDL